MSDPSLLDAAEAAHAARDRSGTLQLVNLYLRSGVADEVGLERCAALLRRFGPAQGLQRLVDRLTNPPPGDPETAAAIGGVLTALGQAETAIALLAPMFDGAPAHRTVTRQLTAALYTLGEFEAVSGIWQRHLAVDPDDIQGWYIHGTQAMDLFGLHDVAEAALRRAVADLAGYTSLADAIVNLGILLQLRGRYAEAFEVWATNPNPDSYASFRASRLPGIKA